MAWQEKMKWWLIRHWPPGYRWASWIEQRTWNRAHAREIARGRELFGRIVKPGDLCFDVGANHGSRTEVFLQLGARVVAVEPQPHCVERLHARFGHHRRFHLVDAAVAEREGKATLHLGNNDLISTLSEEWLHQAENIPELAAIGWKGAIEVPVTTLKALIAEYGRPDFCKIDVEGYELPVLKGLEEPLPFLSIEYTLWQIRPTLDCISWLEKFGEYRFNLSELESMRMSFEEWMDAKQITEVLAGRYDKQEFGYGDVYARLGSSYGAGG